MKGTEVDFKVFTLNCWGIPVVSKDRRCRMQAIAEMLATCTYDVVCLQEVWTDTDFALIRDQICGVLPYSHYFYSGVVGSGVCIFSKYEFQDVFFHQWPVNGYIHKIQHGDWFGGKGVGLCRIKMNKYTINVYSAHLHAEYDRTCDEYQAHRVIQAYDTAQFIQLTSANADLTVLAGDLNTEPGDLAYRILTGVTGLVDTYSEIGDAAQMLGTNEEPQNSYTNQSLVKNMCPGKRIDYIMYLKGSAINVDVKKYEHPLPNRVPECTYSYSDHEAVTATLQISQNETSTLNSSNSCVSILQESVDVCNDALKRLISHKRAYWFITAVLFMLLVTTATIEAPFGFNISYHIIRIVITVLMGFTLIMATLWNMIETNAILAGKLAMEVNLKKPNGKKF